LNSNIEQDGDGAAITEIECTVKDYFEKLHQDNNNNN
jgi:hypothetical protein